MDEKMERNENEFPEVSDAPKTAVQAERIQCVFRGMAEFILSLLLYIWQKMKT